MAMREFEKTLEILDRQYGDYRAMRTLGMEQRACLERDDLAGLEASFVRIQRLMDRIRLRQTELPVLDKQHPEIRQRCDKLKTIILEIQDLRQFNQRSAQRLLEDTREEMRQLGKGRRARRGYQSAQVNQARLFDGTR
jgi:hypothetical protein